MYRVRGEPFAWGSACARRRLSLSSSLFLPLSSATLSPAPVCRPWESAVVGFAEWVSLPPDQIKYVSALLAGIPIGIIFRTVTADPFGKEARDSPAYTVIDRPQTLNPKP